MQIKNPSNKAIEDVKIFGVSYSIDAEGTLDNVPEEHARYWQENLHKFLILRKDKLEAKPEVVEIPTPKIEEVMESVPETEETVEEVKDAAEEELPVPEAIVEEVKEEVVVPTKSKGRPKTVK